MWFCVGGTISIMPVLETDYPTMKSGRNPVAMASGSDRWLVLITRETVWLLGVGDRLSRV